MEFRDNRARSAFSSFFSNFSSFHSTSDTPGGAGSGLVPSSTISGRLPSDSGLALHERYSNWNSSAT